jgi:hypothetical protein
MASCIHHPGRVSTKTVDGKAYCEKCVAGIAAAVKKVDKHVEPKACFVWYEGRDRWSPMEGTGCAHWMAHLDGIKKGSAGEKCHAGYTVRVKTLLGGLKAVERKDVKVGDTWASAAKDHCGLVCKVAKDAKNPDRPAITIRHCSSAQGKVAENDFDSHFGGMGTFLR